MGSKIQVFPLHAGFHLIPFLSFGEWWEIDPIIDLVFLPSSLFFYQELTTLGFPSIYAESKGKELNLIAIINCMNELLALQHKNLRAQEEVEMQHLKLGSDMDHLQNCYAKLKVENKIILLELCSSLHS